MNEALNRVTLVREGVPIFTIVTDPHPTDATMRGVKELNEWIEKITGVALPVTTEDASVASPYIAIGPGRLIEINGWDRGDMKQEEARVFIQKDRIGLFGNDDAPHPGVTWTGTYYAVLELIKKEFGVRWIWPGALGEVYTPRKTLTVHIGAWTWTPDIKLMRLMRNGFGTKRIENRARMYFDFFSIKDDAEAGHAKLAADQKKWLTRGRMNHASPVTFRHSFTDWWDRYGKDHPDWFAKPPDGMTQPGGRGVKLNISHPDVLNTIISNWKKKWSADPERHRVLTVGPNDDRGFDTRPETRAWDAPQLASLSDEEIFSSPEPVLSDRYVKFWNNIARRVARVDRQAVITTFAYRNYQAPPLGDERIAPNIIIGYVGGEGYYPDERWVTDEWKGWADKGATLVWRPNLLHTGHGTPYLFSRRLFDDFAFFRRHGLSGTHFDTLVGNWTGQGLTYYVLAEQHTRPDASYEELAGEYYDAFGPAAEAIRSYHEYFEERTSLMPRLLRQSGLVSRETWGGWWTGHIRVIPLFLTPDVIDEGRRHLDAAEKSVQTADSVYRDRVRTIVTGFTHAAHMAEAFRALKLHEPDTHFTMEDAVSPATREILQPLWDFRIGLPGDFLAPIMRYFTEEERLLGIWSAFRVRPMDAWGGEAEHIPINSGWALRADPHRRGQSEKWYRSDPPWPAKPEEDSRPITEAPIAWYRLSFDVPELADTGSRVIIRFGTIDADGGAGGDVNRHVRVHVWLNGHPVAQKELADKDRDDASHPFIVDISHVARSGARNELVVSIEGKHESGWTDDVVLMLQ